MRRKSSIILTALIVACAVTACQKSPASSVGDVAENRETTAAEPAETPASTEIESELSSEEQEEQDQELYNAYIEVNNFMVGRLDSSLERYFSYVDIEQEEFTLLDADDDYFSCYSLSEYEIEEADNAYALADAKSEKSALDEAYLKLYPSLISVITTLNEIEGYTDMKSYLDDDYQKAKEYHAALTGVLGEYLDAGDAFMDELDTVARERQEKAYAQMKEEGYEVLYAMNRVLDLARDIEDELYEQGVWDENILDMDLEKIQPLYDEFVTNAEALLSYSEDEEKLQAEGIPTNSIGWSSFLRDLKDTKVSLTEVIQKVKNGEALSQSDMLITQIAGQCSLSSFDTGYSSLIDDYNSMVSY